MENLMTFNEALKIIAEDNSKYIGSVCWDDDAYVFFNDYGLVNEDLTPFTLHSGYITDNENEYFVRDFAPQTSFDKFKQAVLNNMLFDHIDWDAVEKECAE